MLTLKYIRENRNAVIDGLKTRNYSEEQLVIVDEIIDLDNRRKDNQTKHDACLAELNALSKKIGGYFKSGETELANQAKQTVSQLKERKSTLETEKQSIEQALEEKLLNVPNVPHPSVPRGNTDEDNEVVQDWHGSLPDVSEGLPHWELARKYNLIDFDAGVKIAGSGFPLYRGKGARLERALINYFLDEAVQAGYEEIIPPLLVNADTARATGQLPDKEGQMYQCERDDLYLIPTAEVPITNICRNVILREDELPVKFAGHTPCFRREAGSYGADVKGLNRVHQFDKVEIVHVAHPDKSYDVLKEMVDHVKTLIQNLELPYRILRLCGGDLGFTSALTYDFEVFSAAQKRWLEVSSVSNFETFQSNRLKLRYKGQDGKNTLAHTLNGSALALARIVAALLENNQTPDGIRIPEVLVPYAKFELIN